MGTGFQNLVGALLSLESAYLWLAGGEGIGKNMETTIMGYIGTTIRIQSFIPS